MQTALFRVRIFPPPSSCSYVFTFCNGSGAGLAADTRKTFVVQPVVWYFVLLDVFPHFFLCPIYQWIELKQSIVLVPLKHIHISSCDRLFSSKATNPYFEAFKCPLQGLNFSDMTAFFSVFNAIEKQIHSFFIYHPLNPICIRKVKLNFNSISFISSVLSNRRFQGKFFRYPV
jgi:hypothetical protein